MERESLPLALNLPMLKGLQNLQGDNLNGFKVVFYVNRSRRSNPSSAVASLKKSVENGKVYNLDLYLSKRLEGSFEYINVEEERSISENKELKAKIKHLEYGRGAYKDRKVAEEFILTVGEDRIRIESFNQAGRIWTLIKEDDKLPYIRTFDGIIPISKGFQQELLKTAAGGLSTRDFFNLLKRSRTLEEFIQIARQGLDGVAKLIIDYVENVDRTTATETFGRFYDLLLYGECSTPAWESGDGYKISYEPNKGILFKVESGKETLYSWIINQDSVYYTGGDVERLYRIEYFLQEHHDGFLKDLLEYLEKNYKQNLSMEAGLSV